MNLFELVKEFHKKFGYNVGVHPKPLTLDEQKKRVEWFHEEVSEFVHAHSLVDQVDAMVDLIYHAIGVLVEMGVPLEEPFKFVHEANMAKTMERRDIENPALSKLVKGENWVGPEKKILEYIQNLVLSL